AAVVAVAANIAHRVLASFVRQQFDLAGEVPLERIGNRALPRAVVAIHDCAFAVAEINRHLARNAAERVHHETLELLIHRPHPRRADGLPRTGRHRPSSTPRQGAPQDRAEAHPAFRAASEETPPRLDGAYVLLTWAKGRRNSKSMNNNDLTSTVALHPRRRVRAGFVTHGRVSLDAQIRLSPRTVECVVEGSERRLGRESVPPTIWVDP